MAAQPRRASTMQRGWSEVKASGLARTPISLMQKTRRLSHDRHREHSPKTRLLIEESLAGYRPSVSRTALLCFPHLDAVRSSLRSGSRSEMDILLSEPSPPSASTSSVSVETWTRAREGVFPCDLSVNIQAVLQQTLLLSHPCKWSVQSYVNRWTTSHRLDFAAPPRQPCYFHPADT